MTKIYDNLLTILTFAEKNADQLEGISANSILYIKGIVEYAREFSSEAEAGETGGNE